MGAGSRRADGVGQLPRGRHGLAREDVVAQQRGRILEAMVDAAAERGYTETRVVDVIGEARVSRKTFYELFADKEECFLEAFEAAFGVLIAATREGYESQPDAPWAERVRAGLEALLRTMAERPTAARFCVVEVLAAGPKALVRRDAALREFTGFLDDGREQGERELPAMTALALVGGIYELLYRAILEGETERLPEKLPEILFWVTQPYLGTEAASTERDRARALLG